MDSKRVRWVVTGYNTWVLRAPGGPDLAILRILPGGNAEWTVGARRGIATSRREAQIAARKALGVRNG